MTKPSKLILMAIGLSIILSQNSVSQVIPDGPYFGQSPPGLTPEVFAPGIISVEDRFEYSISFSPDGKECSFGVTNSDWSWCDLNYTKQENGKWSKPVYAYFQNGYDGWLPFFTHDGTKFFFSSGRPEIKSVNIWLCEKIDDRWSNPIKLSGQVNSPFFEWRPTTTISGTLYFMSNRSGSDGGGDIYKSTPQENQYMTVEKLALSVNSSFLDASPFISPDENYLLFESWQPEGYGQADIYISYLNNDSTWTNPLNLGPAVNSEFIDDGGYISPDGKYFFFNRREAWITNKPTDIYWVDSRIVFKPYVAASINNTYTLVGSDFQFKIPTGGFKDYDDEELNYSLSLFNGDPLPVWLIFDSATMTLSGKSEEIGTVRLKVTATDNIGSSISDEFSIFVLEDKARKPYIGQTPPGMEPKIFAPEIVSITGRLDRVVAFTPDGKELFFSTYEAGWANARIMHMKEVNGKWSDPELASFAKDHYSTEQFITPDGNKIFFASNRPPATGFNSDIWMAEKSNNDWLPPVRLNLKINTDGQEWHPCVTRDGTLYFTRVHSEDNGKADIYRAKLVDGEYQTPEKIKKINTSSNEWDPYVDPDESYLIFKSDRPGGYGDMDMYISFRDEHGSWSSPANMGPTFNTEYHDDSGDVSIDGKYLFFARKNGDEMDIYWVDARIIEQFRPDTITTFIKK